MSRLVEQDGPRAIHRILGAFIVSCYDCKWAKQITHRVDAQDAFELHRCGAEP